MYLIDIMDLYRREAPEGSMVTDGGHIEMCVSWEIHTDIDGSFLLMFVL